MLAVILGGANSVWEDLANLKAMVEPDVVYAINDAGAVYPHRVDFWCTLHAEKLYGWTSNRVATGYPAPGRIITARQMLKREMSCILYPPELFLVYEEEQDWDGSSGLYAVKHAMGAGYDRIVLCGVPMTSEAGHFFDASPWTAASRYHWAWQKHARQLSPKVRSMSGWTMGLLGRPTQDWLNTKENSR